MKYRLFRISRSLNMFGIRGSWTMVAGDTRGKGKRHLTINPSSDRYSFAKAPRYKGKVVQLGPLAELVIAGDPLITSFFKAEGPNTWLRQFVRLHRPVAVLRRMREHVSELIENIREPTFIKSEARTEGVGYGFVNAARGSLGHWLQTAGGQDQKLPSHHPYYMEWLTARLFGDARSLGGKLYRS